MKRTLTTTIAAVLSVGCAIAEEKQSTSLKKTKTVAESNEGTKPEDKKTNSVKAKPTQKVGKQTLVTRTYRVDSKKFLNSLKKQKSIDINPHNSSDTAIQKVVKKYFRAAGVKFDSNKQSPEGNGHVSFGIPKAIYLHRKLELLIVRVTERELGIVDKSIKDLMTK